MTTDDAAGVDAASRTWFAAGDDESPPDRVRDGDADAPADWPALAVETGFAADEDDYYAKLREATVEAARAEVDERERADDRQLLHAVRAMDDADRVANELAERVSEWAGTLFPDAGTGVDGCREIAERDPDGPAEERVVSLATRVADLDREADELEAFIESRAPVAAPNLAALAGPVLAARLISLAGGLETLAKKPSGTLQVLGAEDALFAHLRGHGSSPKHGVIYTHEYVRGTRPEDRGSASRALAGKLTIAARIDHYSGDYRPELEAELDERMRTIRARAADDGGDSE
ncbi:NOP5/NOP56 family protein [Halobaculum magnesiiphilum]|uniref:NOP58 family protein n=1 Tax=Halobaculum magnesiiphilum TaxID=1017351 RepID=A0A8T8WET1_9EURY|nr:NOP5/NOP56 family protein [Halobaculum magnesiiphilum]QZP38367.1 NOP58 family protein [Halobaculum magnesiiphilum]